jgi:[ribosomal protein S18]-alanine N-acetyltransferase
MGFAKVGFLKGLFDALKARIVDVKTATHGCCYHNDFDWNSSMPKTLIRRARSADFPALLAIDQASFPSGVSYDSEELSYFINRTEAETIVLERDGRIAAFLIVDINPKRAMATMVTLDVADDSRRLGYGTRLLRRSEQLLVRAGVRRYELQVDVENHGAIAFYKNHGFRKIGTLKGYYTNGNDAFVMVKTLPASGGE